MLLGLRPDRGPAMQFRLDELVDFAVQDVLDLGGLDVGPVVLDEGVRLEDVGADLVAPGDLALLAVELGDFLVALRPPAGA